MEQITNDIFKNEIILPDTPLKAINSWIIKSKGDVMVVDTGFNLPECEKAFMDGLNDLSIKLSDVDLMITHLHSDHCGLAGKLSGKVKSISIGAVDGKIIDNLNDPKHSSWKYYDDLSVKYDLAQYGINLDDNPGYSLMFHNKIPFRYLKEGDTVTVGEYSFSVIDTPGHTPGLICLYDSEHKILIANDHVLARITPNVSFWGFEYGDILGTYIKSLRKVQDLDVKYILTSHRMMPESLKVRVDELIEHHQERLIEITAILEKYGELSVGKVASYMHWSIRANNWDDFPKAQKWFATSEAMSHLEHLKAQGKVHSRTVDGKYMYELV